MKKLLLLLVIGCITIIGHSQSKSPVKWTFVSKKIKADLYEISFSAVLEKGWHIYSQSTPDEGPLPTKFSFFANPLITTDGNIIEKGKMEKVHEPLFGVDVKQYSNKVTFVQNVKVKAGVKTNFTGSIEYMLCNNKECLPPATQAFSIQLK